ncbi:MAG TPA: TRAM domain-containing protein [Vicinamibacterales bacterium]|nr:TRAM domain-containing protein [Vicinamibacterales bacterium]
MTAEPIFELTVDRPAQGGRMIARLDGAIVLVSGAIPGERVRARITERRHGVAFAETLEVIEPSADRRDPPFDPACGGNLLAHVAYPRQLELKREIVGDAFRRQARLALDELPPISGSPETGYRMRARLHLAHGRIGFFRERTKDVCDAVATGQLSDGAAAVVASASSVLAPHADAIEEIVLAENVAATERVLHIAPRRGATVPDGLARSLEGVSASDVILEALPGGATLERHAASFFQGNRFLLAPLVTKVCAAAGAGNIADLFAGVGLFAAEAASRGAEVIAVESDAISSRDLVRNLAPFGLSARAVTEPVESWLGGRRSVPETVIVDPPRSGLSTETRRRLIELKPEKVVYVSCDPVTLARDVKDFMAAGYRLTHLEVLDLFPNTPHVEAIAVLVA